VDPSGAARFPSSGLRWVRLGELAFLERELSLGGWDYLEYTGMGVC
jgi:hypothetical protein